MQVVAERATQSQPGTLPMHRSVWDAEAPLSRPPSAGRHRNHGATSDHASAGKPPGGAMTACGGEKRVL